MIEGWVRTRDGVMQGGREREGRDAMCFYPGASLKEREDRDSQSKKMEKFPE